MLWSTNGEPQNTSQYLGFHFIKKKKVKKIPLLQDYRPSFILDLIICSTSKIDNIHIEAVFKKKKPFEYEICNQTFILDLISKIDEIHIVLDLIISS